MGLFYAGRKLVGRLLLPRRQLLMSGGPSYDIADTMIKSQLHFDEPLSWDIPQDMYDQMWWPQIGGRTIVSSAGAFEGRGYNGVLEAALNPLFRLLSYSKFSLDLRFVPTKSGAYRIFSTGGGTVGWNNTTGIHVLLTTSSDQKLSLQISSGGGTPLNAISVDSIPTNQPCEICLEKNGTTFKAYINGVLNITLVGAYVEPSTQPRCSLGTIPGESATSIFGFTGIWDEFRLTVGANRHSVNYAAAVAPFSDATMLPLNTFRYWRMTVKRTYDTVDSGTGYLNMSKGELRSTVGGANICPAYSAVGVGSQSSLYASQYNAKQFFESAGLFHSANEPFPTWVQYDFTEPVTVKEIAFAPSNLNTRQPNSFIVQGSDNAVDWITRTKRTNVPRQLTNEVQVFYGW